MRSSTRDDTGSYLILSVELPIDSVAAYETWITHRQFPGFMRGEPLQEQHELARMAWRIHASSGQFAWQARTCCLVPFDHITWKSNGSLGPANHGTVSFEALAEKQTLLTIQAGFELSRSHLAFGDPIPALAQVLERCLRGFHQRITRF